MGIAQFWINPLALVLSLMPDLAVRNDLRDLFVNTSSDILIERYLGRAPMGSFVCLSINGSAPAAARLTHYRSLGSREVGGPEDCSCNYGQAEVVCLRRGTDQPACTILVIDLSYRRPPLASCSAAVGPEGAVRSPSSEGDRTDGAIREREASLFCERAALTNSEVDTSLEALYQAFARYPLGEQINACPCCVDDQARRLLHTNPLRELSDADLSVYLAKAMTTFGTVTDFKHLLPRLLELYLSDEFGCGHEFDLLLAKLACAEWTRWPQHEQQAVIDRMVDWLAGTDIARIDSLDAEMELADLRASFALHPEWRGALPRSAATNWLARVFPDADGERVPDGSARNDAKRS